ncbi:MAG: tRNA lysidine(34) synthetase TilS [Erysipelotrichia bacterium]|nr:tRNA lysidine(34) synthetase TilS [Erysipelotrichia bacterium]
MNYKLDLDRNKRYLVGVSGGSDSMMLLNLCVTQGYDVCVAHVNYQHRPTANRDENIVRQYCLEHNVPIYCCYPCGETGNFQNWAREVRYNFYQKVYAENDCSALLLGHQRNDYLENYLMAKERRSQTYFYGIRREAFHHQMRIIRPLLDIGKNDTQIYCRGNNVVYGDDESNFTDDYQRNRIRHHLVETADEEQIASWLKEAADLNKEIAEKLTDYQRRYDFSEPIEISQLKNEEDKKLFMRYYLNHFLPHKTFSAGLVDELVKVAATTSKNVHFEIENYLFISEYGHFYMHPKPATYAYRLEKPEFFSTTYFTISNKGDKIQQLTINEDDWPITIRNYKPGDKIEMRYGVKKVNRYFIDNKIPYWQRIIWPVVENNKGKIIFVSAIGCDKYHFSIKPDLFVLK